MAQVEIRNVEKSFGSTKIIRGVSVDIPDGEFTVLVGPSGCGKTTLLRIIAGLEDVTAGEVLIGGRVVNDVLPKDRDIAMVFQSYALYPHKTVRENMAFSLRLAKVERSKIEDRVRKAAEILHLDQLLDRYPKQLSGGQRQRVAMGRSIVRNPQVFLFDEPLSNLDAKLRVAMRAEIRELHHRLKTTAVYVTHDQVEAMTMADRIVVMKDGVIEQIGTPLDLYDSPVNTFVAEFIGSPAMNLLAGTAHRVDGHAAVSFSEGSSLRLPYGVDVQDGQSVLLGVRPEHLSLGAEGLPVKVVVVEPTGADTHLLCKFGGTDVNVVLRSRTQCRPGDQVRLLADLTTSHLFDAASGRRLDAEKRD